MKYIPVQAVASRLKDQFDVDMNIELVIAHSAQVLKNMGMIALQREVIVANVKNFCVNLPARVRKIRAAIQLTDSLVSSVGVFVQDIYFPPQTIWVSNDEDISTISNDTVRSNYVPQVRGPYIPFVWDCPYVRFNETDMEVAFITTSIKTDKAGWPMIPEEAFEACIYYCLYVYYQPLYLIDRVSESKMQRITEWKNQKMRFAETSLMLSELSQNEMDDVFNTLTSFDRKKFGINS
jgi:hypothetical protein